MILCCWLWWVPVAPIPATADAGGWCIGAAGLGAVVPRAAFSSSGCSCFPYRTCITKPFGKWTHGRPRCRRVVTININFRELLGMDEWWMKDLSFHLLFLDLLNDVFNYVRQCEYK
jgi:hypothetical protein